MAQSNKAHCKHPENSNVHMADSGFSSCYDFTEISKHKRTTIVGPKMYSTRKIASENDEWGNEPRASYSDGMERNWIPFENGHVSAPSTHDDDFTNSTRNTRGCDAQQIGHMTSSPKKGECDSGKSPFSPCNNGFVYDRNPCKPKGPSKWRTACEDIENERFGRNFSNTCDGIDLGNYSSSVQAEEERNSSNNLPEEIPSKFLGSKADSDHTRSKGAGLGCKYEMNRKSGGNFGEKQSERLQDSDTVRNKRTNVNESKETSIDDTTNDERMKRRLKNLRKEPKRILRGRMRHVHKKRPKLPQENAHNVENMVGDPDGVWTWALLLASLLKKGLLTILAAFPVCLRAGYTILWYLMTIGFLFVCLVVFCLGMCLKWFFCSILNKVRALRSDFDAFSKRRRGESIRTESQHEQVVGGSRRRSDANQQTYSAQDLEEGEIVSMLLASRDLDAYGVLGVSEDSTDEEIKRKYREMAKIVHPDKNSHQNSGEAFQILQSAFESISDQEKRMAYRLENNKKKFEEEFEEFFDLMNKHVEELKSKIMCSNCNKTHPRLLTDRLINAARYCAHCDVRHSAKEGDVWVETSHMGFKYYCYLCIDDQVFEVTEWAACQGLLDQRANTHGVYLSVKPNRPAWSTWDDLFGDSEPPTQPTKNKKKRNKCKPKPNNKNKRR